jgi:hypothetical protein
VFEGPLTRRINLTLRVLGFSFCCNRSHKFYEAKGATTQSWIMVCPPKHVLRL